MNTILTKNDKICIVTAAIGYTHRKIQWSMVILYVCRYSSVTKYWMYIVHYSAANWQVINRLYLSHNRTLHRKLIKRHVISCIVINMKYDTNFSKSLAWRMYQLKDVIEEEEKNRTASYITCSYVSNTILHKWVYDRSHITIAAHDQRTTH